MGARAAATAGASAGDMFQLIRDGHADTRSELGRLTGLSRTAVTWRVDQLMECGLVVESAAVASTGGRPPARLSFNTDGGIVLAAALGASRSRLAVCDLAGRTLAADEVEVDFADGPDVVLASVIARLERLLAGRDGLRGIGVSVPNAVDTGTGRSVRTSVQPAWADVAISARFAEHFAVPVRVDNDVNVLALAEHQAHPDVDDLLVIKASTGVGAGIIAGGRLLRGALGASGEIGHNRVAANNSAMCRCGNVDCLETVAGGWALVRAMAARGVPAQDARAIADLANAGNPDALHLIRTAGRHLGEVVAGAVNLLNPAMIIVGGDLAEAYDPLVAGMRELIYQSSTAAATRDLRFERSTVGATRTGCAIMILADVLSPDAVNAVLATRPALSSVT